MGQEKGEADLNVSAVGIMAEFSVISTEHLTPKKRRNFLISSRLIQLELKKVFRRGG